ncbi:hypothetical protein LCGC14_1583720 [marine sediment metagenome]|uniref:Uncharacterized protein n=1 Tax=marine sediment metagenome TaxID=412755 RepID=A0A0F9IG58_9ZZZZ
MSNEINLINQKFGKLHVLNFAEPDDRGRSMWFCLCDCGNEKIVRGDNLYSGRIQSCGCLQKKNNKEHPSTFPNWKKSLKSTFDEVFDISLDYEKREELKKAYDEFWDTLDPELVYTLKMMLV